LPPEVSAILIGTENEEMAFGNAGGLQGRQAVGHQSAGNTPITVNWADGEVIQIAPSTVMAAKDGTDDGIAFLSDKTHTRGAV
jgi:hypothetical protein